MKMVLFMFVFLMSFVPSIFADSTYVLEEDAKQQAQEISHLIHNWNESYASYQRKMKFHSDRLQNSQLQGKDKQLATLKVIHTQSELVLAAAYEYRAVREKIETRVYQLGKAIKKARQKQRNEPVVNNIENTLQKIDFETTQVSAFEKQVVQRILEQSKFDAAKLAHYQEALTLAYSQMQDMEPLKLKIKEHIYALRKS